MALASETNIPIFQSPKFAPLPSGHANVAGLATILPFATPQPDLVILLGCRTGMFLGMRSGAIIPANAKIIHVDTDATEPGRTLPTTLAITSSSFNFLSALEAALHKTYRASDAWLRTAMGLREMKSPYDEESDYPTPSRMHPHKALSTLFRSLPPGAIIISDGGEAGAWSFGLQHLAKPSLHMIPTGYLGFLGTGYGYSLGAALAKPDSLIVNIQGDGSAGFHFMELDTYARFGLRVCTVVVNNVVWGMSVHGQELVYGGKDKARPASALKDIKWATVAGGLGVRGTRVERLENIESMVKDVLGNKGPSCVDLQVSSQPIHPGTTAMVGMTDDPNMVVVPYYDNIPRATYKL